MDDSTCCGTCLMKSDLQNSTDKFAFLKDNWPSFGQIESIDKLSKQELNCTLCFLNVLIDEFVNEKSACPNRVITRLVLIRREDSLRMFGMEKWMYLSKEFRIVCGQCLT